MKRLQLGFKAEEPCRVFLGNDQEQISISSATKMEEEPENTYLETCCGNDTGKIRSRGLHST